MQERLLLIVTAILIAPISEELIFRGYIFGVLRRYAGPWWAMIISASIFAAIHAHIPSLAGLFVLAVALTLVYREHRIALDADADARVVQRRHRDSYSRMAGFGEMKLRDVSEDRLLEILLAELPAGRNTLVGPGDDCAVVKGVGIRGDAVVKNRLRGRRRSLSRPRTNRKRSDGRLCAVL